MTGTTMLQLHCEPALARDAEAIRCGTKARLAELMQELRIPASLDVRHATWDHAGAFITLGHRVFRIPADRLDNDSPSAFDREEASPASSLTAAIVTAVARQPGSLLPAAEAPHLAAVLDAGIALADEDALHPPTARPFDLASAADTAELLIEERRAPTVEVRMPTSYLDELTRAEPGGNPALQQAVAEIEESWGIRCPPVTLARDDALPARSFRFRINDVLTPVHAGAELGPWEHVAGRFSIELGGVLPWLLGLSSVTERLDELRRSYPLLVQALEDTRSVTTLTQVLRRLVGQGLSVRNLRRIVEALVEFDWVEASPAMLVVDDRLPIRGEVRDKDAVTVDKLTAYSRMRLRREIVGRLLDEDGVLRMVEIPQELQDAVYAGSGASYAFLASRILDLVDAARARSEGWADPIVVCGPDIRSLVEAMVGDALSPGPVPRRGLVISSTELPAGVPAERIQVPDAAPPGDRATRDAVGRRPS